MSRCSAPHYFQLASGDLFEVSSTPRIIPPEALPYISIPEYIPRVTFRDLPVVVTDPAPHIIDTPGYHPDHALYLHRHADLPWPSPERSFHLTGWLGCIHFASTQDRERLTAWLRDAVALTRVPPLHILRLNDSPDRLALIQSLERLFGPDRVAYRTLDAHRAIVTLDDFTTAPPQNVLLIPRPFSGFADNYARDHWPSIYGALLHRAIGDARVRAAEHGLNNICSVEAEVEVET